MYSHREMINSLLLEHFQSAAESYTRELKGKKTSSTYTHSPLQHSLNIYVTFSSCVYPSSSCVYPSLSARSKAVRSVYKNKSFYFLNVETSYPFFFPPIAQHILIWLFPQIPVVFQISNHWQWISSGWLVKYSRGLETWLFAWATVEGSLAACRQRGYCMSWVFHWANGARWTHMRFAFTANLLWRSQETIAAHCSLVLNSITSPKEGF